MSGRSSIWHCSSRRFKRYSSINFKDRVISRRRGCRRCFCVRYIPEALSPSYRAQPGCSAVAPAWPTEQRRLPRMYEGAGCRAGPGARSAAPEADPCRGGLPAGAVGKSCVLASHRPGGRAGGAQAARRPCSGPGGRWPHHYGCQLPSARPPPSAHQPGAITWLCRGHKGRRVGRAGGGGVKQDAQCCTGAVGWGAANRLSVMSRPCLRPQGCVQS